MNAETPDQRMDRLNAEAVRRYERGERVRVSTGICGGVTMGYGHLDSLGYWEFPIYRRQLRVNDPLLDLPESVEL